MPRDLAVKRAEVWYYVGRLDVKYRLSSGQVDWPCSWNPELLGRVGVGGKRRAASHENLCFLPWSQREVSGCPEDHPQRGQVPGGCPPRDQCSQENQGEGQREQVVSVSREWERSFQWGKGPLQPQLPGPPGSPLDGAVPSPCTQSQGAWPGTLAGRNLWISHQAPPQPAAL